MLNLRLTIHYGLTIFLSAFLLFQVQPMVGKMILPWFGGSASVWTTCMLFFQTVLLLGYFYSHWIVSFLTPARQSLLHGSLLLVSLLLLPIVPSEDWKPTGAENPTLRILGLLTVSIGLPYFVLSTTGPLIQAWFARERSGQVPYRLFALSNFGSMLALLAYPIALEPVLPTLWQSYFWSGLFALFVVACGLLAWRGRRGDPIHAVHHEVGLPPTVPQMLLWAALAACPSILMVADTSYLTTNIAPIPMLWVAPLALYLLSFILTFEHPRWYRRTVFLPLLVISLGILAWLPTLGISALPFTLSISINLVAFFVACMVCHGELARRQPHPGHLTSYYLMLAVGGAAGGFFVGVIAPYFFDSHYELSIGIVLTGFVVLLAVYPLVLPRWRVAVVVGTALAIGSLGWVRYVDHAEEGAGATVRLRNFYGALKVFENTTEGYRTMLHGQIVHGRQYTDPGRLDQATAYYSPHGGMGKAMLAKMDQGPLRVGIIGLGVGTLVGYGRSGDSYRLYEIDPLVIDVAREHFSFLSRTPAQTEMVLGDARLQLEGEASQQFDLLVVDAFSGDSVPIHLLTREAFSQYFRHLKPDGVLAVHITNRFLDLRQVVATGAVHFDRQARMIDYDGSGDQLDYRSSWALISADPKIFAHPLLADSQAIEVRPSFKPWRDDYSSLFAILK
jgi:SAM-dependent methyltransferase